MKSEFWHERWESNQLGFHQAEVNRLLMEHWPGLGLPAASPVFVPLCGKSLDMTWLRAAGHPIVGVEFSPIAVHDFFAENQIEASTAYRGVLECSSGSGHELYCGDFFDMTPEVLSTVRAVYDRAALIALPPELRKRYAEHLIRALPPDITIMLITLEYDSSRMNGPPHSVPASEVEMLFGESFAIEVLWSSGPEAPTDRFRERGLDVWCETAWRLDRGETR
jgi:thiopurine S-methyltransferase